MATTNDERASKVDIVKSQSRLESFIRGREVGEDFGTYWRRTGPGGHLG